MPEFIRLIQPDQAFKIWMGAVQNVISDIEEIETIHALYRVTANPVISNDFLPAFDRANVDGFAVRAMDTHGASESLPAYFKGKGEVPMGSAPVFNIKEGEAGLIHTGGMIPAGADAVVMLEYTQSLQNGEIEVMKPVAAGENVLFKGEDVKPGEEIIEAGVRLRPEEIGGLLALGITNIMVKRIPRVGILSSGDEIIPPGETPKPGQVRDINSYTLGTIIEQTGGTPVYYGILPDVPDLLEKKLAEALDCTDMVLVTAGSSASSRDFTTNVIAKMGKPGVLVHGINIKPGKPTILAVCQGKPVIGMPGNPVSAVVIAKLFVQPMVKKIGGLSTFPHQLTLKARLTANISSQAGRDDYIPVRIIASDEGYLAEPIFYKSNLIFTLASADGLLHIPANANGIAADEFVDILFLRD